MNFEEGKIICKNDEYYQMCSRLSTNPKNANAVFKDNEYYLEHLIKLPLIEKNGKKYQKLCAMRSPQCEHKKYCSGNISGVDWCNNVIIYYEVD